MQQPTQDSQQFLESILPGVTGLTRTATSDISNLLNGLPSVSQAQTTNAYWGVGAGQPATGGIDSFIGQRGTDLYGQQANANRQQGLGALLQTIGTYTQPALSNQGQALQNQQFNQNLRQQASQFGQSQNQQNQQFNAQLALQAARDAGQSQINQFNSLLSGLGLGNSIVGNG